jgi:hypothetical protein
MKEDSYLAVLLVTLSFLFSLELDSSVSFVGGIFFLEFACYIFFHGWSIFFVSVCAGEIILFIRPANLTWIWWFYFYSNSLIRARTYPPVVLLLYCSLERQDTYSMRTIENLIQYKRGHTHSLEYFGLLLNSTLDMGLTVSSWSIQKQ